ncbi:MAG: XdhC family protein, partial [Bacteroidetes bacterium]|nr:XdhC family protein [Bacteroidota bacterium]
IEPLTAMPKLYIFGAGHVGREVARVGLLAGFRITVFDERKGIFEQFGVENCTFVNDTYAKSIDVAVFDENTYNVIVTPKHEFDEAVLELVAKKPHAYTGMMGSRSKIAIIKKNYLDRGVFTEEEMKQIDMPIGIRFEAETPFEIAVSIMAKIIDTKNRKSKA